MTFPEPPRPQPPLPPPRPAGFPPRRRPGIRLRSSSIIISVFLLVVAGAGVGIMVLFLSGRAVAAEVVTEPIATAGANPFMPSVGTDKPGVTPPAAAVGHFPADTPGLYGGTRNNAACDPAAMVTFLQANPDKANAWAGVLGISVASIPGYVAELTPVILRSDVPLSNHLPPLSAEALVLAPPPLPGVESWTMETRSRRATIGAMVYNKAGNRIALGSADGLLLPSVAAAVIGGTSIFGGRGGYAGSIVGALILTVLTSMLTVLNAPQPVRQIIYGAIILGVATAYARVTGER
jgi:hypothetical protein